MQFVTLLKKAEETVFWLVHCCNPILHLFLEVMVLLKMPT